MELPPHLFFNNGLRLGVEESALRKATYYTSRLLSKNAYPVLTLNHLSLLTGASYHYLREVVQRSRDPYESIEISQRSGKLRAISAPEPIIHEVQRWILDNILDSFQEHQSSFAYSKGKSIVQCAALHRGANWILKIDLHDFFGTIKESAVYKVFKEIGFPSLLSFELARICTRAESALSVRRSSDCYRIRSYSVSSQGKLPQGSATSGKLANAVAYKLDEILTSLALSEGLVYTRYSDDMVFSSHDDFSRGRVVDLLRKVTGVIHSQGFIVHRNKTRIISPGARKIILGLLVNDDVRLLPEHRRRIESHLRGCEKFGLGKHVAHRGFESVFSFVNHLDGWIAFALGVERIKATVWRERLRKILNKEGLFLSGQTDNS